MRILLSRRAKTDPRHVRLTEASKQIELGPMTIAKMYRREGSVRFLDTTGATDVNQLTAEDVKSLPPVLGAEILEHNTRRDRQTVNSKSYFMKVEDFVGVAEESDGLSRSEDVLSDEE